MPTPHNDSTWRKCKECRLYATRRFVVLNRTGYVRNGIYVDTPNPPTRYPSILFIGEAPGRQEDHTGIPFQGESGRILHMIFSYVTSPFSYTITNLIACRPLVQNDWDTWENRTPVPAELAACKPRLDQLLAKQSFDGLVYIGKLPQSYTTRNHISIPSLFSRAHTMVSPASIAKMEYKLFDIKQQALKLEQYVNSTTQDRTKHLHRT